MKQELLFGLIAGSIVAGVVAANALLPNPRVQLHEQQRVVERIPIGHFCIADDCRYGLACIDNTCDHDPGQRVPNA